MWARNYTFCGNLILNKVKLILAEFINTIIINYWKVLISKILRKYYINLVYIFSVRLVLQRNLTKKKVYSTFLIKQILFRLKLTRSRVIISIIFLSFRSSGHSLTHVTSYSSDLHCDEFLWKNKGTFSLSLSATECLQMAFLCFHVYFIS